MTEKQQLEQLQQEYARVQATLAERAHSRMGEFLDTLGYELQLARQGHPVAQQNLVTLAGLLKEIMETPGGSRIVRPNFQINGPLKPPDG